LIDLDFLNFQKLTVSLYNVDSHGTRNYLSSGETSLPVWYFVLSFVFFAEMAFWIFVCRKARYGRMSGLIIYLFVFREYVRGIHKLMTVVVMSKVFNLFFESVCIEMYVI
jgi:hypothetical protein